MGREGDAVPGRHSVPVVLDDAASAALRADLAGWTVDATRELLGPLASAALDRDQRLPALRVLRTPRPDGADGDRDARRFSVLTRLFMVGDTVPEADVRDALAHLGLEAGVRAGLVERVDGAGVRARVDLRPFEGAWLLSDLGQEVTGRPLPPDHVLGAGGASLSLARATVRREVGRVLDLGTGCGVQALLASRHAREMVATDVSPRALAMARVTLALAGRTDVDLRTGSMLEPVAGERFDLVVSNPPFVITPGTIREDPALGLLEYRDGGREGDAIVAALVREVGDVLAPGGVAQLLANWEHGPDGWEGRVREWLDAPAARDLDAWVVQRELLDPANYVEMWLRDGGTLPGTPAHEAAYGRWLEDFERRGVTAIGFGAITLRRPVTPGAAPWRRLEEVTTGAADGGHVAAVLDAVETLRGLDDVAVAELRPVVAPDVTEERHHRPGEPDPSVIQLRQGGAYARTRRVDTLEAGFTGVCDGELSVRQIAGALAALLDLEVEETVARLVGLTRELLVDGFLTTP